MLVPASASDQSVIEAPGVDAAWTRTGKGAAIGATPLQLAMRHRWAILAFALTTTGLTAFVLKQIPPRYEATASMVVDAKQVRVISESLVSGQMTDFPVVRTRLDELRSPRLAREVVNRLHLTDVPEVCAAVQPAPKLQERVVGWIDAIRGHARPAAEPTCPVSVDDAVSFVLTNTTPNTDGRSYVITLRAEARDPKLAANIANAYADAFVAERLRAAQSTAERANAWLATHTGELRRQMEHAAQAVEEYRARNQLTPLRGETITAQSLSERNSQLGTTINELATKQSTLSQMQDLLRNNGRIDASAAALASPVVQRLVEAQAELVRKLEYQRTRFGSSHPDVAATAAQVARVQQQIRMEVGKTVASLSGEVAALQSRRNALAGQVRAFQAQLSDQSGAEGRLRELERDVTHSRNLYDTMLTRLTQISAEQGLQSGDVQISVEAQPSDIPFFPRTRMIVVGTFLAMLGVGAALAFALSLVSRLFRDAEEVEEYTGLPVLGMFPRPMSRVTPHDVVLDKPTSLEAEALHSIVRRLAASRHQQSSVLGKVVMITSALPSEGKTSFSVALGRSAAQAGLSTVLIDCDLRRPKVRKLTARGSEPMVVDGVAGEDDGPVIALPFQDAAIDSRSRLHVVSATRPVRNPHEVFVSPQLPALTKRLQEQYDLIILDTPPVLAVTDAVSLAALADEVLMLVSLRQSARSTVSAALKLLYRAGVRPAGIILSKVNLRQHARSAVGRKGYSKIYRIYGVDPSAVRS